MPHTILLQETAQAAQLDVQTALQMEPAVNVPISTSNSPIIAAPPAPIPPYASPAAAQTQQPAPPAILATSSSIAMGPVNPALDTVVLALQLICAQLCSILWATFCCLYQLLPMSLPLVILAAIPAQLLTLKFALTVTMDTSLAPISSVLLAQQAATAWHALQPHQEFASHAILAHS